MKNFLSFFICLFLFKAPVFAQKTTDSLSVNENFKITSLIIPSSLVIVASFGVNGFLEPVNKHINEEMDKFRCRKYHIDDYAQYLPLASVYGLSLSGAQAKHNYRERTLLIATSCLLMGVAVTGVKYTVRKERPDLQAKNSFPSGHTATAFLGAELIRLEYKEESIWYGIAAYSVASAIGFMRVYNERHWLTDVIAGAGLGILSAQAGYLLLPYTKRLVDKIISKKQNTLSLQPFYVEKQIGIGLKYCF